MMASLLPSQGGILPYWLLLVSGLSVFNSVACYTSPQTGRRPYQGPTAAAQTTDLSTRLFGTWTLLSCAVRAYCAYHLDNREVYALTLWTFAIALGHFGTECWVYKTMKPGKELMPSLVIASVSTVWMLIQWK